MPTPPTIGQQAIDLFRKYGTKANVARELLDRGYSASEISKAVPMAYSQVHSIQKQRLENGTTGPEREYSAAVRPSTPAPQRASRLGAARASGRPEKASSIPLQAATRKAQGLKVGKLRTPGYANDREVGECANCGHDLVVRDNGPQVMLIHVNIIPDEYLSTIQFCQAVPKRLLT
jgi:hypothetical protein